MQKNKLQIFFNTIINNSSPIPKIICGLVLFLFLTKIVKYFSGLNFHYYNLSLESSFDHPFFNYWTIFTHPFIHKSVLDLLFECLCLFWIGNLVLRFLTNKQFSILFWGGIALGCVQYMLYSHTIFSGSLVTSWNGIGFGLISLISSLFVVAPNQEVRMLLIGNIKLKHFALTYVLLQIISQFLSPNPSAILASIVLTLLSILYTYRLNNKESWIQLFKTKTAKNRLKLIRNEHNDKHTTNLHFPDQEIIDQILDKISSNGYESLTSQEKEMLFKISKKRDEG